MREIIFRGKRTDNGEWAEGYFVHCKSAYDDGNGRIAEIIPNDADRIYKGEYSAWDVYEVNYETVGQFTGLTDKNGKRIFEGDIFSVTWIAKNRTPVVETYVAGFKDGSFYAFRRNQIVATIANYAKHSKFGSTGVFVEVIGNIHDNPELLEG